MTILDNGKILIYDFFYNCLKTKYRPKRELIYTDTDSFLLDMDIAEDIDLYDKSNYPKDHMLYNDRNKKVLGRMKGEYERRTIKEAVTIRPKMYSVLEENQKNIRKAKGAKKNVV